MANASFRRRKADKDKVIANEDKADISVREVEQTDKRSPFNFMSC